MIKIMPALSPIVRLSSGLTLLTISLLLLLDFFGVMPDESGIRFDSRKTVAELLADEVTREIGLGKLDSVSDTLKSIHSRNADMVSVAIRMSDGGILMSVGDHAQYWVPNDGRRSSIRHLEVPIYEGGAHWGSLELSFEPPIVSVRDFLQSGSINIVLLFVAVIGFFVYWMFLKRALRELDPRSVIPERVNSALNVLAEGLVMLDRSGRMVLVNRVFEQKSGQPHQSLIGSRLSDLPWVRKISEGDTELAEFPWVRVLEHGGTPERIQLELQTALNDNFKFAVNTAAITAGDGSIKGVVVTFDDVTELQLQNTSLVRAINQLKASKLEIERKKNELEVLATRDPLTGVLNRRSLFEGMDTLIAEAQELREPLSCVMVDIDHFKSINDRFGHGVGDDVIKMMADIFTEIVSPSALVARYGGEEFVVVLPSTTEEVAEQIANKMRVKLYSHELNADGEAIRISASFGVSCDGLREISASNLIDRADQAMYRAKDSGRNRVCKFSDLEGQDQSIAVEMNGVDTMSLPMVSSVSNPEVLDITSTSGMGEHPETTSVIVKNPLGTDDKIVIMDRLMQGIDRSKRYGQHLAVLCVNIDVLEIVNNTFGSAEADKVINSIKAHLKSTLRESDTIVEVGAESENVSISRVGIAELIILITDLGNSDDFTWIVKRIASTAQAPIEINDNDYSIDMRIGISLYPGDGQNPQKLLATARSALRDAKMHESRNSCLFFDAEMNVRSERQLLLESQLQRAIERNELFLVYQPYVNLQSGKLAGFETLVRWKNPQFGMVSPEQFIPIAERNHLMDPIGRWIFTNAMRQLREWRSRGNESITLAVNFSPIQLQQEDFMEFVEGTVAEYGIPPSAVTVEITESMIIEDRDSAAKTTLALQAAGFRVALDDFGTGYSSLLYLKDMPIDVVKIDRSFFNDFPNNERDASIVAAIISLSNSLGLTVVAEGVETEEQLKAILQLRCDNVQGYVFSAPLSREHATALLADSIVLRRMLRPLSKIKRENPQETLTAAEGLINELNERDLLSLSHIKVGQR